MYIKTFLSTSFQTQLFLCEIHLQMLFCPTESPCRRHCPGSPPDFFVDVSSSPAGFRRRTHSHTHKHTHTHTLVAAYFDRFLKQNIRSRAVADWPSGHSTWEASLVQRLEEPKE
jgi:hypothetical protein